MKKILISGNLFARILVFVIGTLSLNGCALYKDAQVDPYVRERRQNQQLGVEHVNPFEEMNQNERDRQKSQDILGF